jgi:hypothetical protein
LILNLDFNFKVSNAMLQANDWEIKVLATDDNDQTSDEAIDPDFIGTGVAGYASVYYWGESRSNREGLSFGSIAAEDSSVLTNQSLGSFVANGETVLRIAATDFVSANNDVIELSITAIPSPNTVAFHCQFGAVFSSDLSAVLLSDASPGDLASQLFAEGTGETADASLTHSCQLTYFGGAPRSGVLYSSDVTLYLSTF